MDIRTAKIIFRAAKAIRKLDAANVYVNPKDVHFKLYVCTPAFEDAFFKFTPAGTCQRIKKGGGFEPLPVTDVTLKAYGEKTEDGTVICDGATDAPDWPTGVKPATGIHDPGYLSIPAIANAWKDEPFAPGPVYKRDWITRMTAKNSTTWTADDVQQLIDSMFGDTMRDAGARGYIYKTYFTGVRLIGGPFRKFASSAQIGILVLTLLTLSGCNGGCMAPPDILDFPDGVPELEQTQSGDLTGAIQEIVKEAAK